MMSDTKTRKVHSASFKAKVALEAVRETKTLNEIGQEYGVHPVQVSHWKKALLEKASDLFEGKRGPPAVNEQSDPEPVSYTHLDVYKRQAMGMATCQC